jgi:hypothetical protein
VKPRLALLAGLGVAAALAAAVLLAPRLDWNRYRGNIAAIAADRLGRSVTIAGPVTLALWPAPELTADQVDIGSDGHGGNGFHVASLRLRVGLRSLLAGRVEARDLVLRGVDLRLPWPLPQAFLTSRPPHWLGAFAASIEGGTLHLGQLTVADIDATVTQADDGSLATAGTAHLNAQAARFTMRLGPPRTNGEAALDVSLDGIDRLTGTGASLSGTVAADGSLAGHATASGTDLALLIDAPHVPFRAEGRMTVGDGLAAMDEATLSIGGAPASGALALRLPPSARLDVALEATRLDLDPWLAVLLPATRRGMVAPSMPFGIDLAVEAARLGGGMIQHLRARADSEAGSVRLSDVSAILPGDAQLRLDGRIDAAATQATRLTGTLRLDAPALRTTLRWLTDAGLASLPLPPGTVLRTAALTANLRAEPGSLALESLSGRVDGAAVTGSLRLDGGAHPGFAVDIATDNLALDAWLPTGDWPATPAAAANWLGRGGPAAWLGGQTAQLSMRADHATMRGVRIDGLILDTGATADGRLTLRRLDGAASGLRLTAAGTIGRDGRLADATLSLNGAAATPLAALAPAGFATPALWKGPVALAVTGSGPPSALALGIALDLGDGRLEAQPVIDLTSSAWHGAASLRHPGAARLLAMLGLMVPTDMPGASDWPGDGSLSLTGQFSRAPGSAPWGKITADGVELTAGMLRASGRLTLDGREVSGAVSADVLPLPLPDAASPTPLQVGAWRGWSGSVHVQATQIVAGPLDLLDHAALTVTLAGDRLTADGVTGQIGDGTLTGKASLNVGAAPPTLIASAILHGATIRDIGDDAPVALLSGRLDGTVDLVAGGYSPAAMLATLSGTVHATVHNGALAGFDLFGAARAIGTADAQAPTATEQALRASLERGTTNFDTLDLTGVAAHGLLSLTDARLQGPAGSAQAQGSIGLTDGTMDIQVALAPSVPGSPGVGVRLDGMLTSPAHQPELAAASRWLAERRLRAEVTPTETPR